MTGTKKRSAADSMGVEAAMVASPNNGIAHFTGYLLQYCYDATQKKHMKSVVDCPTDSTQEAAVSGELVEERGGHGGELVELAVGGGHPGLGRRGARERGVATDPGLASERQQPQRGHGRGPVQDAARLAPVQDGARLQRVPLAAARSAAIRRWPCRSAEAAPGTDPSRDAQKATSTKSRIASRESATVSAASAPP